MSRKGKSKPEEKVRIVEDYINGEIGICEASRLPKCSHDSVKAWIRIYKETGPTGLLDQVLNQSYSKDIKLQAIHDYLNGNGSQSDICKKYGIRSRTQLRQWIKVYNTGGTLKKSTGGTSMKKARTTTPEDRLIIVKDCFDNEKNYGAIALQYNCSYQQVRNWVMRYEEMGTAGLEDRRGRRAGSQPSRSPDEELRYKIAELERRNKDLQMENDLLKKVRELSMKDHYH